MKPLISDNQHLLFPQMMEMGDKFDKMLSGAIYDSLLEATPEQVSSTKIDKNDIKHTPFIKDRAKSALVKYLGKLDASQVSSVIYTHMPREVYEEVINYSIVDILTNIASDYHDPNHNSRGTDIGITDFLNSKNYRKSQPSFFLAPAITFKPLFLKHIEGYSRPSDFIRQQTNKIRDIIRLINKPEEEDKNKEKIKKIFDNYEILSMPISTQAAQFIIDNIDKFGDDGKAIDEDFYQEIVKQEMQICVQFIALTFSLNHNARKELPTLNPIAIFALHKLSDELKDQQLADKYRADYPINNAVWESFYKFAIGIKIDRASIKDQPGKSLKNILSHLNTFDIIETGIKEGVDESYFLDEKHKEQFKQFLQNYKLDELVLELTKMFVVFIAEEAAKTRPTTDYAESRKILEAIISIVPSAQDKQNLLEQIALGLQEEYQKAKTEQESGDDQRHSKRISSLTEAVSIAASTIQSGVRSSLKLPKLKSPHDVLSLYTENDGLIAELLEAMSSGSMHFGGDFDPNFIQIEDKLLASRLEQYCDDLYEKSFKADKSNIKNLLKDDEVWRVLKRKDKPEATRKLVSYIIERGISEGFLEEGSVTILLKGEASNNAIVELLKCAFEDLVPQNKRATFVAKISLIGDPLSQGENQDLPDQIAIFLAQRSRLAGDKEFSHNIKDTPSWYHLESADQNFKGKFFAALLEEAINPKNSENPKYTKEDIIGAIKLGREGKQLFTKSSKDKDVLRLIKAVTREIMPEHKEMSAEGFFDYYATGSFDKLDQVTSTTQDETSNSPRSSLKRSEGTTTFNKVSTNSSKTKK